MSTRRRFSVAVLIGSCLLMACSDVNGDGVTPADTAQAACQKAEDCEGAKCYQSGGSDQPCGDEYQQCVSGKCENKTSYYKTGAICNVETGRCNKL